MKFIPPLEIASKVMTLIEESREEIIIVSPFININNWIKMQKCLDRAYKRNIKIKIITRSNANNDFSLLSNDVELFYINDLHAKLYLNESYGIISSQNMIHYSDNHSIDIGYITKTVDEYKELREFITKYLLDNLSINDIKDSGSGSVEEYYKLSESEIMDLLTFLNENTISEFNYRKTYLWTNTALIFTEVLLSNDFTVKLTRKNERTIDCIRILEKIQVTKLRHQFYVQKDYETNENYIYWSFVPNSKRENIDLFSDYLSILKLLKNKFSIFYNEIVS